MSTPNTPRPAGGTGGTRPAAPRQNTVGASRPAGAPQRPGTAQRPSGAPRPAGQQQRPAGSAPRPAGAPNGARPQQLVRPVPKAKVRKARLLISKVDAWSVLKMAFLLSVALGIVTVVGSVIFWTVLDLTGIFATVNAVLADVIGTSDLDLTKIASLGQVASFATILAVVNVVLLTVLSMLAAVLYNLASTLVGGIGVTLTDD